MDNKRILADTSADITAQMRQKTKIDLKNKLKVFGHCVLARCTGFGKTWLVSQMTQKYDRVLYLYPAEVIKDTAMSVIEMMDGDAGRVGEDETFDFRNIKFMTYMKLIRLSEAELDDIKEKVDLIIMDEVHRTGAKKTSDAVRHLIDGFKGHIIGATATPDRMDAMDFISEFFGGVCTYEYTLHDAIQDGIIKRPIYCYCTYDIETDLKDAALTAGEDVNNITVKEVLKSKLVEISNIYNMPSIIKDVTKQYCRSTSYQKFIVFFANFKQMEDKKGVVEGWFQTAYPKHSIKTLTINSKDKESSENVHELDKLVRRKNGIDLIFCIDMLNMGYHVNDLTGIVMYRGTSSSTIYIQQLGRALSTGSENACIVFDVVDNLHRKAVYCLSDERAGRRPKKTRDQEETIVEIDVSNMSSNEIAALRKKYLDEIGTEGKQWWRFCNKIEPTDLYATGHEATYRELIAKAVAQPIAQRCKVAQEEHYRRFCKMNDVPYPATAKALADKNLMPPLESYARWQNVSVSQILNMMLEEGKISA